MSRVQSSALLLVVSLIATGFGFSAFDSALASPKGARWGADYFPNVTVVTHEGKKLKFYDDLIKNKKVVINFIYTSCPDICSLSTARMREVQERLRDVIGKDIFIYSISMQPEIDTPEVLNEYANAFDVRPGWLFLTGKPKDMHLLRYKLGERSRKLTEHRSDAVLGNDEAGEWARTSVMTNLDYLASQIRDLDPAWRNRKVSRIGNSKAKKVKNYRISKNRPGEGLYLKACATCHTIGKGDRVGPDLKGVTVRRDHDWLVQFMVRPNVLRARKDPIALALDAKYPGIKMPNLRLSETDAEDLINYIKSHSKKLDGKAKKQSNTTQPSPVKTN